MNHVRALLPTDLPVLLAHSGLSAENAARPRERLGADDSRPTLSVLRDQLMAFARQRSAWVSMRRQHLQGLVGARQRGGAEAWEIDYLLDVTPDLQVATDLLEYVVTRAGKEGALKIFLRLPSDSDLLQPALQSGFVAYKEETLYSGPARPSKHAPSADLRESAAADSYPLFRLYCEATPETVRRVEAATFEEWHAAQEQRWLKNGLRLVLDQESRLRGELRACRLPQGLMLDVLVDSEAASDIPGIISAAVAATNTTDEPVLVLVPHTAEALARALEDVDFSPRNSYVSLVRRTTKPLALPRKVPVVAKNAIGV